MSVSIEQTNDSSNLKVHNEVVCIKCNSNQVIANKRGYSFKLMFLVFFSILVFSVLLFIVSPLFSDLGIFLVLSTIVVGLFIVSLPVAILCGFIGRSKIVNGCMSCGRKWKPGMK